MNPSTFRVLRVFRGSPSFFAACLVSLWLNASAVEVPPGFIAETLATNLNAATAIAPAADGRIFIADQTGRVLIWKNGAMLPKPALTLHVTDYWERGLIGLTLHPEFPRPPHLFALYVTDKPFVHHVLSRFTVNGDEIDPASEKILLEGDDQAKLGGGVPAGHQGGVLRFGNDGRIYVSLGEQTAGEPAQQLDTLQGKILRLNEDGSAPNDNPFVAQTKGKYRVIDALGVRNSFGIAAQSREDGGRMFFTDVGGSAFEEINELAPGANYGWPRAEGFSTNTAFKNPLHAYPPQVGQSIVGGVFLPRASQWPEKWRGRFFYADFIKHWLKALDPAAPTNVLTFARGFNGPVATELAPDGSLLVLNRGAVWRDPKKFVANAGSLVRIRYVGGVTLAGTSVSDPAQRNTNTAALGLPMDASLLPPRTTQADWDQRVARSQSRAFSLNDGEWQPFMRVQTRAFLPPEGKVRFGANDTLEFPTGTVFVREFSFASVGTKDGGTPVQKLVERRLHVIGAPDGYGAAYRINAQGDAELIEDGEPTNLGWGQALDASKAHNAEVAWWFPSLELRLSRPVVSPLFWIPTTVAEWNQTFGNAGYNALSALQRAGFLDGTSASSLPTAADWRSPHAPAEARVRTYLQANCAVCHQPGGASRGVFDARITTPLAQAGIVNGDLAAGDLGIPGAKIVVPGSPDKSILVRRLKDTGFFRMPATQTHNELSPIVPVMEEWIRSLATNSPNTRP